MFLVIYIGDEWVDFIHIALGTVINHNSSLMHIPYTLVLCQNRVLIPMFHNFYVFV